MAFAAPPAFIPPPLCTLAPVPDVAPGPRVPCFLSGGEGEGPDWLGLPFSDMAAIVPWGQQVDPADTTLVWYQPPLASNGDLVPRGLTLTPHVAGLLVKEVWGWVAQEGVLSPGSVITMVGFVSSTDRTTMASRLAAGGMECDHVLQVAVGHLCPAEWTYYPRDRDVLI